VSAAKCRSSVVRPYVCEQGIETLLTTSELQIYHILKIAEFLDVMLCGLIDMINITARYMPSHLQDGTHQRML
jgi:hypothetical protein